MKRFIFSYLHFSRRERLGIIALTIICAVVFALPDVIRLFYPEKTTDFSGFQADIQAFRTAIETTETPTGEPGDNLFTFDPNTASFDDFVRLGLSEKVANIIFNYRDKGGKFREAADFQKIWLIERMNEKYKKVKEGEIWVDEDEDYEIHLKIANKKCYIIPMKKS